MTPDEIYTRLMEWSRIVGNAPVHRDLPDLWAFVTSEDYEERKQRRLDDEPLR